MIGAYKWLLVFFCLPTLIHAQDNKHTGEWSKISYNIETNVVASMGEHTPFWFVSNRHGKSSIENKNANSDAIDKANKYVDDTKPWALAKDEAKIGTLKTVMYNLVD